MPKVRYIDTNSYDTMHEHYNTSLLAMCCMVFASVEYIAGASCRERTRQLLARSGRHYSNLRDRKIHTVGGVSRLRTILRLAFSAVQNVRLLLFSPKDAVLLYNYNNLLSLFALNGLNKLLKRKVLICCHGEMEFMVSDDKSGGPVLRLQRRLCKSFFLSRKRTSNLYFIVIGDSILRNIRQHVSPHLGSRFISVDHSYIFGDTPPRQASPGDPLRIGTVGVLNRTKGFDELCALARKTGPCPGVELSVTGRIFGDPAQLEAAGIDLPAGNGHAPLPGDEFAARIEQLDYILFLYPRDSYRMIASGAVMDSIDKARPIISLHNEYFDYLFGKYGPFGLMADTLDEMSALIRSLARGEVPPPAVDFDELRSKLKPETLKSELQDALTRIGYL